MIWAVRWTPRAAKERDRLDARVRERVLDAIQSYAEFGVGDDEALTEEELASIASGRADHAAGRVVSHEQVKREFGW